MNRKSLLLVLAAVLLFGCANAQAGIISGEDDDVEWVLTANTDGTFSFKVTGALAEGDILVAAIEIPNFAYNGNPVAGTGEEITALSIIQITDITGNDITFGAYTGGFNAISPVDVADGDATEGAVVAFFVNDTATFDLQLNFTDNPTTNCTSFTQCITEATAGDLLQVDGFAGDPDEYWISNTPGGIGQDLNTVRTQVAGSVGVASFNAAITTFVNNIPTHGTPIAFQTILGGPCPLGTSGDDGIIGCVAGLTLTGSVQGGMGLNPALNAVARSDFNLQKLTAVPEPTTLALLGFGLVGLAAIRFRRR